MTFSASPHFAAEKYVLVAVRMCLYDPNRPNDPHIPDVFHKCVLGDKDRLLTPHECVCLVLFSILSV